MKTKLFIITTVLVINQAIMAQQASKTFDINIKEMPAIQMLYYEFIGSYDQSFNDFGQLMGYMQQNKISMGKHSLGIFYDDPENVAPEKLKSEIGFMTTEKVKGSQKYKYKEIPAGKAVTVKYSSMDEILPAYKAISEYIDNKQLTTAPYSVELYYSNDPNIVDAEIVFYIK